MLKSYFKIAWRNLIKNKVFSLINILGLTIGITVCLMIYLFILHESSYDNFHANGKNIYRVMRHYDASKPAAPYLSGPYATALRNDFPGEIRMAVRTMITNGLVSYGNNAFNEKKVCVADSGFFSLFSFPALQGDPATALRDPGSVVLTESAAKKYFGSEDPMGKTLTWEKTTQMKVTAVVKDPPANSHLDFDLVTSMAQFYNQPWFNRWINNNFPTYLLLDGHANPASLEKRFPAFMDKYTGKEFASMGYNFWLTLTPLKDIYFERSTASDSARHGDKKVISVFLSIAALVLLIACINFTNLATIRAVERSKEVGLRKVMGALRNHLVAQFIGESFLLAIISSLLALSLLILLTPVYDHLLGYPLDIPWYAGRVWLFLGAVVLIVGLTAGLYPAWVLSAFSPIQALKGKLRLGKGGAFFRQTLVVVQFSISVLLVLGTLVIMRQMSFMKNRSLGYDQDHAILIPLDNSNIWDNMSAFKKELTQQPSIASVSMMSGEPGGFFDSQNFEVQDHPEIWRSRTEFADFEYVKTMGLKIIAGRDLSPEYSTDTTMSVLINRAAAYKLGWTPQQAIGKSIKNPVRDKGPRRIVGVVEDFNFLSLKEDMDALVISPSLDRRVAVVRLRAGNLPATLESVKKIYARMAPQYPFEYTFLDQKFELIYKNDLRQQSLLELFSGLAIFIACLGLFGLASFTAAKRLKEIGVRKILGSSTRNIVLLLTQDLLKPVLLATLIALPLGYYLMGQWLQQFAFRTGLNWWIFALAALLTLLTALLTVSIKALRAARINPAQNLRNE